MSIRMLAIELYRTMKHVEELEKEIKQSTPGSPKKERLEQELRSAKAEQNRLRAMLEGAKE